MNTKTFEDYKNDILAQYQKSKNGIYLTYLISPTRSGLRDLALLRYENATVADKTIFDQFFKLDDSKDKKRQIENFNTDRFRALCNFFEEKNSLRPKLDADLAAILVDFSPRPFEKYLKTGDNAVIEQPGTNNIEVDIEIDTATDLPAGKSGMHATMPLQFAQGNGGSKKNNKRILAWCGAALAVILCIVLVFKEEKKCMVWKEDHYEAADCNAIAFKGSGYTHMPLNTDLLENMKKVTICDTTTFFNKQGKPCIWYGKSADKKYEFFTSPGQHPETRKSLKEISYYMINKIKGGKQTGGGF